MATAMITNARRSPNKSKRNLRHVGCAGKSEFISKLQIEASFADLSVLVWTSNILPWIVSVDLWSLGFNCASRED